VVDEHAGELVADGTLHDGRRDRGVDAPGQGAQHPRLADLLADPLHLFLSDVRGRPGRATSGDVVEEVGQHLLAVLGVQHLRVPLDAGEATVGVLERRDRRARGASVDREAGRGRGDLVTV